MTHFPPSVLYEKRRKLLRWIGIALSVLMGLIVVSIFGVVLNDRLAHDEAKCPFRFLSERPLSNGRIVEQQRACTSHTSERRYMLERRGQTPIEVAVRRLPPDKFREGRYEWKLTEKEQRVSIDFRVDGRTVSEFREQDQSAK